MSEGNLAHLVSLDDMTLGMPKSAMAFNGFKVKISSFISANFKLNEPFPPPEIRNSLLPRRIGI